MFQNEQIMTQPFFYGFIVATLLLTYGYFWGRRMNRSIFLDAFNDLVRVVKPKDQTFTNIGGAIGYHANLFLGKKNAIEQVDATITLLPRHAWLYMPISKLIMRHDRLFITFYLVDRPPGEGHLIEKGYAAFRGPKIKNADRLFQEPLVWGKQAFTIYYANGKIRDQLMMLTGSFPDPGNIRHVAVVTEEKRCFVFMIPKKGQVARDLSPVHKWILSRFRPVRSAEGP